MAPPIRFLDNGGDRVKLKLFACWAIFHAILSSDLKKKIQNILSEIPLDVKNCSDQAQRFVPSCLQRSSVDITSRQRINTN